jgi:hypothetical protein
MNPLLARNKVGFEGPPQQTVAFRFFNFALANRDHDTGPARTIESRTILSSTRHGSFTKNYGHRLIEGVDHDVVPSHVATYQLLNPSREIGQPYCQIAMMSSTLQQRRAG